MARLIQCDDYDIHLNSWEALNEYLEKSYSSMMIIVDENTEKYCLPLFQEHINRDIPHIVIPQGERYKNLNTARYIWQEMVAHGLDRHSLCINLGGGVIGDMGGWTASAFMRGMDFIQIPTTLLSMVDASVGGKLGIDFDTYKNLIGLIKNPGAVFIMTDFLTTLTDRLLRSGFAEVLKHGLIADLKYWDKVKQFQIGQKVDWESWIYESVLIKKAVTEEDPMERGLRKILNYGHTLGHAIESLSFQHAEPLLHGEAIAIGMITEAHLSYQKGMISEQDLNAISSPIISLYGKEENYIPSFKTLHPLLLKDKKNKAGVIMYSLLEEVGKCTFNMEVTAEETEKSLEYYLSC